MSDENITFDNNVSDTDSSEALFYDEFLQCTDVTKPKPYEFEPLVSSMESEDDLDYTSNQIEKVSQSTRVCNVQWCDRVPTENEDFFSLSFSSNRSFFPEFLSEKHTFFPESYFKTYFLSLSFCNDMYYPVSFGLPIICPHFKISTQYDKPGNKYDCIMYYNEVLNVSELIILNIK